MAPMEYTQWFIAPMEKAWFYERFFIEVVMIKYKNAMAKVKKIQYKRYNVNKNFLYYMKWTSVMLPIVFQEFELACIFLLFFPFHCNCQLVKDELQQKFGVSTPVWFLRASVNRKRKSTNFKFLFRRIGKFVWVACYSRRSRVYFEQVKLVSSKYSISFELEKNREMITYADVLILQKLKLEFTEKKQIPTFILIETHILLQTGKSEHHYIFQKSENQFQQNAVKRRIKGSCQTQ